MIHTYTHYFQIGTNARVYISDNQTTFRHAIVKWSLTPPAHDIWFANEYQKWWNYICTDFYNRTGRIVMNPVAA